MKLNKVLVALLVTAALATPALALADHNFNGYFRTQMTAQDLTTAGDGDSSTFVDNRLRMKYTNTLNDKVKLVYYGEVDTPWGSKSKGSIGGGGEQGADAVNLETKNAYLNFKTAGWDFTFGIQNMHDNAGDIVIDNDVAGLKASTKMGMVGLTLNYAKLYEADRSNWDDEDFYGIQTSFGLSDTAKLGADVLFFDDNANELEQLYLSVDANIKLGAGTLSGFVLYGDYSSDNAGGVDGSNWAASGKFATKLGENNFSVTGILFGTADSGDIVLSDDHGTGFQFYNEGLMIFLTDIYYNNGSQGAKFADAAFNGFGLAAVTCKGDLALGNGMYLKYAAGYFMALDDSSDYTGSTVNKDGSSMGIEADVMVGKKINEKVDLSVRGAYALLGDFYDAAGTDSNDPWKVVAMLNVGF